MHKSILLLAASLSFLVEAQDCVKPTKIRRDTPFVHPGALHTSQDIERVKNHVKNKEQPWLRAMQHLETLPLAQTTRPPIAVATLTRGIDPEDRSLPQNYANAYRDAHGAYQLALRWLMTDDTKFADAAVKILNAWSSTLKTIRGNGDRFLAAGIYGYEFANVGELMRTYSGWSQQDQDKFGAMLNDIFAKYNRNFLDNHNGIPAHYYANWYQCNIASLMAIGIFNDNQTMFDFAVDYFRDGPIDGKVAYGALPFFSIANFTEEGSTKILMQGQEAGRDQGHAMLDFALLGVIGQQGRNQGVDTFGFYGSQILNGAEYAAKYNTNHTVPYTPFQSYQGLQSVISDNQRFNLRPGYEAIYSYYAECLGQNASWSKAYRDYVNADNKQNIEGGGGDYGTTSGGFDAFGHGTLMYRLTADT
ncbi:exopolysaccharide inner membrane protein-like protein [Plenodomus tracheiphilus IPT5]|uniref:Exopolysaccharide inner membrane protein-like protein n=1 Tax=Plenodomus tracheiphilus IPT5 TaxID=1408161 RepID=A0A6A7BK46_9PLEO|nr:exopolysaccharide inner membrane protein-like protein [Plenodomus tracheiphilus IPT5]